MENELISTENNDDSLNMIYYGIAKQLLDELLEKSLITREEYYQIDDLNRSSFKQNLDVEN